MTNYIYDRKEDVEIVVGDEKQTKFYPRMKIMRWGNEVNFSVGVISAHQGSDSQIIDKVEWNDGHGIKARFYEKPNDEFEFEIEFTQKPKSNVLHLSIETKGLDFYYQPELTKDEVEHGASRPENVVGSYAVYHSTMAGNYIGGNNYRAGKAFHIYRPYAVDAKGTKVWCDLHIDTEMHITIPPDFIDNAAYPIIVDPTFGVDPESPGGTVNNFGENNLIGSLFTSPAVIDTVQQITAYVQGGWGYSSIIKGLIVLHSNLNIISDGIGEPSPSFLNAGWRTSVFGTDPSPSPSTEYVLMVIANHYWFGIYYDAGEVDQAHHDTSNSYDSPTNPTDASHSNSLYSVYCTYTAGAAAGARPSRVFSGPFYGALGGAI